MSGIYSAVILIVGIAVMFIAGFPVAAFAFNQGRRGEKSMDAVWAAAPFAGYAAITFLVKIGVLLDIPVQYSAWPVFIFFAALFVFYILKQKDKIKSLLPSRWFVICILVLCVLFSISYILIGSKFYRGFAWWDTIYYGSQAEFFRSAPYSSFESLLETQPYLGSLDAYTNGAHRIVRALAQAFVAAICGTDGASTIGYISISGIVFVFCALIYVTDKMGMKPFFRYAACFSGSAIAAVVVTQLEGFIPVCLFIGFVILCCGLFLDVFKNRNIWITVTAGLIVSAFSLTFTDGLLLIFGLCVLSVITSLLSEKHTVKSAGGIGLQLLAMLLVIYISLPPFNQDIMYEIKKGIGFSDSITRTGLNFIYPFAYSPKVLTYVFFGYTLDMGDHINPFRFVSIFMFIAGIWGIIYHGVKKHFAIAINFAAVIFMPVIYLCMEGEYQYAFYKSFSLCVPLLVLGIWIFWSVCRGQLKERFLLFSDSRPAAFLRRFVPAAGTGLFSFLFFATTLFSAAQSLESAIPFSTAARRDGISHDFNADMLKTYEDLEGMKNQNVLIICRDVESVFWWMSYYARNNTVYGITHQSDDTYFRGREYNRTDVMNIPQNAVIFYTPSVYKAVQPADKADECAAVVEYPVSETKKRTLSPGEAVSSSSYDIPVFSKQDFNATLSLEVACPENASSIHIEGEEYSIGKNTTLSVPLQIKKGGQRIVIEAASDHVKFSIVNWSITIHPQ